MKIVDKDGHKGVVATEETLDTKVVYTLEGPVKLKRTRESIQIGPYTHVEDEYGIFFNHSSKPTVRIVGREVRALKHIKPGDEITFDYMQSESKIASPFTTEDGQLVQK